MYIQAFIHSYTIIHNIHICTYTHMVIQMYTHKHKNTFKNSLMHVFLHCLGPRGVIPWSVTDRRAVVPEWVCRCVTPIAWTRYVTKQSFHVIVATTHVWIRQTETQKCNPKHSILLKNGSILQCRYAVLYRPAWPLQIHRRGVPPWHSGYNHSLFPT